MTFLASQVEPAIERPNRERPSFAWITVSVVAILLLGLALRLYRLGAEPLWVDEVASLRFSERSLSDIWGPDAALETNPPLYYTVLHAALSLDDSEEVLRNPSVLAGVLTILITYGLGRVIGGHWVGIAAGFLVAISRIHIQYSQEARSYAMLIAVAMLACLCTANLMRGWAAAENLDGAEEPRPRKSRLSWIGYVVATAAALYLHNTAVLLPALLTVAVAFAWFRFSASRRKIAIGWVLANLIVLAIWSAWLPVMFRQSVSTIRDFWIPRPDLPTVIVELIRLYGQPFLAVPQGLANKAICAGGMLLLAVMSIVGLSALRSQRSMLAFVAIVIIGQPALLLLISQWRPMFIEKIMLWPTPLLCVLLATGCLALKQTVWRTTALLGVGALYAWGTVTYFSEFRKEPWDDVATMIRSEAHADDFVLYAPAFTELSFEYYYPSTSANPERAILQVSENDLRQPFLFRSRVIQPQELSETVADQSRVWVLVRQINPSKRKQILDSMAVEFARTHELVDSWDFDEHIKVNLFQKKRLAEL